MLGNTYDDMAARLWDYLAEELPDDNEAQEAVHAGTLHYLDEALRAQGVEVN